MIEVNICRNNVPVRLSYWLQAVSLVLLMFVVVLPQSVDARNWKGYCAVSKSDLLEDRGRWSVGKYDQVFDLSGSWQVSPAGLYENNVVTIPFVWSDWNEQIILSRYFKLPQDHAQRQWKIVIDGASHYIQLNINGQNVESRAGEDLSFQVDVDYRTFNFGDDVNLMKITIGHKIGGNEDFPSHASIYTPERYSGISRGIYLVAMPMQAIEDVLIGDIQTTGDKVVFTVESSVKSRTISERAFDTEEFNKSKSFSLDCKLFVDGTNTPIATQNIPVQLPTDGTLQQKITISANLAETQADQGKVLLTLLSNGKPIHEMRARFSQGYPSWNGNGWVSQSGKLVKIRCVDYYTSQPETGRIISHELVEQDVQMLLGLGADAVRICNGSASIDFLDCCDRNGLMVFEELPVFQTPDKILGGEVFIKLAANQLTVMLERDRRFSCIAGWGLGAGINPPNSMNRQYFEQLTTFVRSQDDRPLFVGVPFTSEADLKPLDFAIIELTRYDRWLTVSLPTQVSFNRPVLVGGIRSFIFSFNTQPDQQDFSEPQQAAEVVRWVKNAESMTWVSGVVAGDYTDWEGAVPAISGPSHGTSSLYASGLVSPDRKPRLGYRKLRELWIQNSSQPLAHEKTTPVESHYLLIAGFLLMFVLFYSMRQNNILRVNISRSLISPKGLFQDIFHQRYFQVGQTWLLLVLISGTLGLIAAGWLYSQRNDPMIDWVVGYIFHSDDTIQWLASLFWHPMRGLLFFWMLFFVIIWINVLYASFLCTIFNAKYSLAQSLDLVVWSWNVIIGILPLAIFADRIYAGNAHILFTILLLAFCVWGCVRLIWVFQIHIRRSLTLAAVLWVGPVAVLLGLKILLLEYSYSLITYGDFFWKAVFH